MQLIGARPGIPISAAALLGEIGLDVPDADHVSTMTAHIRSATDMVETAAARPIGQRDVAFIVERCQWSCWWFPVVSVQAVTKVETTADWITWDEVPGTGYAVANPAQEPRLIMIDPVGSDVKAVRVAATVGALVEEVDPVLLEAVKLVAKTFFERDLAIEGGETGDIPQAAWRLIRQKRYLRPREAF